MGIMGTDLGALALRYTGMSLSVSDHDSIVAINIFIALLCGCIVFGHLLEGNRWVNESTTALIMVRRTPLPRSRCLCFCLAEEVPSELFFLACFCRG
jgi:hypothetical protein